MKIGIQAVMYSVETFASVIYFTSSTSTADTTHGVTGAYADEEITIT